MAKLIEYVFYLFLFYKNIDKVCEILKEEGIVLAGGFAERTRNRDNERYKVACILCNMNYGGQGQYSRIIKLKDWNKVQSLLIEEVVAEEKAKALKKMPKDKCEATCLRCGDDTLVCAC